jgi:hypothetical protein
MDGVNRQVSAEMLQSQFQIGKVYVVQAVDQFSDVREQGIYVTPRAYED